MDIDYSSFNLARELRIGNLLLDKGYDMHGCLSYYRYTCITAHDIAYAYLERNKRLQPIKLKPHILDQLGFQKQHCVYRLAMPLVGKHWAFYYDEHTQSARLQYAQGFHEVFKKANLCSVHQLQNAYFLITATELDVSKLLAHNAEAVTIG